MYRLPSYHLAISLRSEQNPNHLGCSLKLFACDFSPHGDLLKELMSEIQGLRSQFQALQMRRELSALRSDMLQAKSLLADAGSRLDDLPGEDASKQGSDLAGRTVEAGVVQNIPSILSSGMSPADFLLSLIFSNAGYVVW